jgi:hypothetical protein
MTAQALKENLSRIERKISSADPSDKQTLARLANHKAECEAALATLQASPSPAVAAPHAVAALPRKQ